MQAVKFAPERRMVAAVVPGGVPDHDKRVRLVADLTHLASETPEVDVEAMRETLYAAARALFADALLMEMMDAAAS